MNQSYSIQSMSRAQNNQVSQRSIEDLINSLITDSQNQSFDSKSKQSLSQIFSQKSYNQDNNQQGRLWIATLNNPQQHGYVDPLLFFKLYIDNGAQGIVGQLERGGEMNILHYQYVVQYQQKVRFTQVQRICRYSHIAKCKNPYAAIQYVQKKDHTYVQGPWQMGTINYIGRGKQKNKDLKNFQIDGAFNEDNQKLMKSYQKTSTYELNKLTEQQLGEKLNGNQYWQAKKSIEVWRYNNQVAFQGPRQSYWIYGAPRIGKSRYVKQRYDVYPYIKSIDKWWCRYQQQKVVLLDDFEIFNYKDMLHHLKIWCDPFGPLQGETKGGSVILNFEELYITSNYSLEQVFHRDALVLIALKERIRQLHFVVQMLEDGSKQLQIIEE